MPRSAKDAAGPAAAPTPVQKTASPAPKPPTAPQGSSSVQEVNELFRWLAAQPAQGDRRARPARQAPRIPPVIYTIPRADPARLAAMDSDAQRAAYQENLEAVWTGSFPAFSPLHGVLHCLPTSLECARPSTRNRT